MMPLLALVLIGLPILELYVIVQVAQSLGVLETVGLLVLVALVGVWLVRVEGLGVLSRMQGDLANGQVPTSSLLDGVLILAAGVLLVAPGFVTDVVGVLLLLPPTRALLRRMLVRRYRSRVRDGMLTSTGRFGRFGRFGQVIVVDGRPVGGPQDGGGDGRSSSGPDEPPRQLPRP